MSQSETLLAQTQEAWKANDTRALTRLAEELTELGVYPVTPYMLKNKTSATDMIKFYGVRWHEYSHARCPSCFADLRDLEMGPPFGRAIGVYSREQDRTVAWQCPDCGTSWPRSSHGR
jgi:uncharacterized protein with PIN domain